MPDIYLYPGEPNPNDIRLSDPTALRPTGSAPVGESLLDLPSFPSPRLASGLFDTLDQPLVLTTLAPSAPSVSYLFRLPLFTPRFAPPGAPPFPHQDLLATTLGTVALPFLNPFFDLPFAPRLASTDTLNPNTIQRLTDLSLLFAKRAYPDRVPTITLAPVPVSFANTTVSLNALNLTPRSWTDVLRTASPRSFDTLAPNLQVSTLANPANFLGFTFDLPTRTPRSAVFFDVIAPNMVINTGSGPSTYTLVNDLFWHRSSS